MTPGVLPVDKLPGVPELVVDNDPVSLVVPVLCANAGKCRQLDAIVAVSNNE